MSEGSRRDPTTTGRMNWMNPSSSTKMMIIRRPASLSPAIRAMIRRTPARVAGDKRR